MMSCDLRRVLFVKRCPAPALQEGLDVRREIAEGDTTGGAPGPIDGSGDGVGVPEDDADQNALQRVSHVRGDPSDQAEVQEGELGVIVDD